MTRFSNREIIGLGIHAVLILWFLIMLRKGRIYGFEMNSYEFVLPVAVVAAIVLCVFGLRAMRVRNRSK